MTRRKEPDGVIDASTPHYSCFESNGGKSSGNIVPVFSNEEVHESFERKKVSVLEVFRYASRLDVALMIVGSVAAVGVGASLPAFSFVFGHMVNDLLSPTDPESTTAKTAVIMVYVGLGVVLLTFLSVACWMVAALRQVARVRLEYLKSVLRQDIGWHDGHSPGSLTARVTGDMHVLQNGINDKLGQGITNLSMGVLGFVFGFALAWELALVLLGMMPVIALMGAIIGNVMAKMSNSTREHFAAAGSIATEVMENVRTVQNFGREDYEVGRFEAAVLSAQRAGVKKELLNSTASGMAMAVIFVTYTIAFFFASYLIQWGRRDVGDVVACFLAVLMGSFGIGFVSPSLTAFAESRAAAYHVFQTIQRTPVIDVDAVGEPVRGFSETIEFRHVRFAYPTRRDMKLFEDLSLVIERGRRVAFSGASGCGKSSIIALIQRFYDPIDGDIFVDGTDMRKLSLRQWRDQIGVVSQEPNLFAGTMMENVRVGKPDATEEEVIEACKHANIHDTIMSLPDMYNTSVGAVGSQLSGGQKQRLAIARAIVRHPAILLLDEATSALDRKSELEVQAALDRLMEEGSMTIIVVAHRLATIRNVDRIYYFSYDGVKGSAIEEVGTFDELLAKGGKFAAMATSQGVGLQFSAGAQKLQALAEGEDRINTFLDDDELAKLDEEQPRTERQMVPFEELAKWEAKRAKVGVRRLISLTKGKTVHIAFAVLGSAITGGTAPANGVLFGKILAVLGGYSVDHDTPALRKGTNTYAPLFLVMAVVSFAGWMLQSLYGYAGEHLTTKLRVMLFSQILRQDMSFFDIPGRDAGTLSGMLSGDCEAVHQLWGPSIGLKAQTFCTIAVGVVIAFIYQWKLALVALACVPLVALGNLVQHQVALGLTQKNQGTASDTVVTEALSNIRTVTSFNIKDDRVAIFRELVRQEVPRDTKRSIWIALIYGISQFMFFGAYALCFWYGGKLISAGEATFERVIIASMAVLLGASGAGEAGSFAAKAAKASEAANRVFSVIDRVPDIDVYREGEKLTDEGCDITFRKVKFIYPARPKQLVLAAVDANFRKGTTNGLMGQTGCGKSTIIQILARFYDYRSGKVFINGKDLRELDVSAWRESISIVLQEPDLFSGTVRDNIRYSSPSATNEEVEEAARLAGIHDDILRWPQGYDTGVGYRGRALSGGQKQRVALARGFLRRAKLLLLDEATCALDNVTEERVQEGINEYQRRHGVTVISIAHRLTTIRHCDQIILLDSGRIHECGSHEYLMSLNGEYRTRWELYANVTT
ncbi:ATP-binding cassette, sub-family B (MDR/TAP), member 1 [Trypanosoma conorhini]|uniref:ATP-binding cassette, sub-family B (MDR/TAP), member 1 n=1 Tax=Trypanosoma conorhini TaxID=83891 RepID=A0A3R7LCJ1_9TRYP|nr:ATP-binding cassette, sub-family B (MDR/TAP), member 1 [Trypanosoma conorhini]RNF25640.1 ATP-binding cassette, sub-family B (MDR/TAP), member 1 [Trypanosoma conorhini]